MNFSPPRKCFVEMGLVAFVVVGCGSPNSKSCTTCAATEPQTAGDETAQQVVTEPEDTAQPEVVAQPQGEAQANDKKESTHLDKITSGLCVGTEEQRKACVALGDGCFLDAEPVLGPPHPCRNRGARCLEDISIKGGTARGRCMCTCDPEYNRMRQDVETRRYERRNPNSGGATTPCREPKSRAPGAVARCPAADPPELPR